MDLTARRTPSGGSAAAAGGRPEVIGLRPALARRAQNPRRLAERPPRVCHVGERQDEEYAVDAAVFQGESLEAALA